MGNPVAHGRTFLSPERLAELAAQGREEASRSPFVNPFITARATRLLAERGERWARSVLNRDLSRRALYPNTVPWFETGELETLVLADQAEMKVLEDAAQNPKGIEGDLA